MDVAFFSFLFFVAIPYVYCVRPTEYNGRVIGNESAVDEIGGGRIGGPIRRH